MLVSLFGALIIAVVLLDVFLTVLDANGFSLLSSMIYRRAWWCWRHFTRMMPVQAAHAMLSLGAPLMIPMMIGIWTFGLVLGFTFIYFGGYSPDDYLTGDGSQPTLDGAFRLSWVTLSTIGFVEVSPSNMPYSLTVALEAIIGSLVMTFTITYFLSVHRVVISYNELVAYLNHRTPDPNDPITAVSRHFVEGRPNGLEGWLGRLQDGLVALHEGLRRYPIIYYFRPRRAHRSLPYTISALRGITSGLMWGFDGDASIRRSPRTCRRWSPGWRTWSTSCRTGTSRSGDAASSGQQPWPNSRRRARGVNGRRTPGSNAFSASGRRLPGSPGCPTAPAWPKPTQTISDGSPSLSRYAISKGPSAPTSAIPNGCGPAAPPRSPRSSAVGRRTARRR